MLDRISDELQSWRVRMTPLCFTLSDEPCGAFLIPKAIMQFRFGRHDRSDVKIIAYDGSLPHDPWEHVSVSLFDKQRCPTWEEMCFVKSLFWGPEETVLQIHPPESKYVNTHPYCLHLWRLRDFDCPIPNQSAV